MPGRWEGRRGSTLLVMLGPRLGYGTQGKEQWIEASLGLSPTSVFSRLRDLGQGPPLWVSTFPIVGSENTCQVVQTVEPHEHLGVIRMAESVQEGSGQ